MDHRVSKDMISSGMIPSGEKKKEDLGRTQYGSAPSPSSLADAYKSMYEKKEEVINEMSGMGMTPKKAPAPAVKPPVKAEPSPVKGGPSLSDKDAKRERLKKIMADNESVDLLAAYRAVYEHHKKDADGNTIPHEDEELNEFAVTGTLGALKVLGSKLAKSAVAGAAKAGSGKLGLKATATAFKKPTMSNISKVAGHVGKGMVKNPINTMVGAQMVGSMIPKPSMTSVTKKQNQGGMVSADADLFDIVKGQLLDEGLSEEEIKDIMLTLTPDEILNEITAEFALDASKKASAKSTMLGSQGDKQGMMDKASQAKRLYDKSAEKRRAGNYKQAASAAGPASKKGLEGNM